MNAWKKRFWDWVEKTDGCWLWRGSTCASGYGYFSIDNKTVKAHRTAWVIAHGDIPKGMCVCHHCDNPRCVRASHLFLGTFGDNNRDRARKGRSAHMAGETNVMAKLTDLEVEAIRSLAGQPHAKIAKQFGVHRTVVSRILRGRLHGVEVYDHIHRAGGGCVHCLSRKDRICVVCSKVFRSPRPNTICCGKRCGGTLAAANRNAATVAAKAVDHK